MSIATLRERYSYNRWANDRLMGVAVGLSEGELDRAFDIGPGSLRRTLKHIYGAERIWYQRMQAPGHEAFPRSRDLGSMRELGIAAGRLADARLDWLESLDEADLDRQASYAAADGQARAVSLRRWI